MDDLDRHTSSNIPALHSPPPASPTLLLTVCFVTLIWFLYTWCQASNQSGREQLERQGIPNSVVLLVRMCKESRQLLGSGTILTLWIINWWISLSERDSKHDGAGRYLEWPARLPWGGCIGWIRCGSFGFSGCRFAEELLMVIRVRGRYIRSVNSWLGDIGVRLRLR